MEKRNQVDHHVYRGSNIDIMAKWKLMQLKAEAAKKHGPN